MGAMWRILAILLVLTASLRAETVRGLPKPTGYVSDFAGVLDAEARAQIEAQCTAIHQKTGTQIAVVTIHHLEGDTAQEFAQGISDAWHVGSKGTDKGVVMLFSIDDHKRWINVGYGLEGPLNDAKVGDIGRTMVPLLKTAHYREAITIAADQIAAAISANPTDAPPTPPAPPSPPVWPIFLACGICGGVFLAIVIVVSLRRRQPTLGAVKHSLGMPILTSMPSEDDSRSSFSSSSSNDSSSSSSSSDFGGFDGGSSGGGGAGGDW